MYTFKENERSHNNVNSSIPLFKSHNSIEKKTYPGYKLKPREHFNYKSKTTERQKLRSATKTNGNILYVKSCHILSCDRTFKKWWVEPGLMASQTIRLFCNVKKHIAKMTTLSDRNAIKQTQENSA